tara:strand:+ start:10343 stop:10492 length:150 start_codon:yes stop_codon:yes gene_type:complete
MKATNKILLVIGIIIACTVGYGCYLNYLEHGHIIKGDKLYSVDVKKENQ